MAQICEYKFETRAALFAYLLADVIRALSTAIDSRGQASMLLSGGTSPGPLYRMMSDKTFAWDKVWFGLSDERWVPADHPDSNENLVRTTLLTGKAALANFIGLKSPSDDIIAGQDITDQWLRAFLRPFDLVLLGMGLDGHTASLFPDSADTAAALDQDNKKLCHPIRRGVGEIPRMTMTRNALLGSHGIKLLIFGPEKWQVYQQAKATKSDEQPVSHLLNQTQTPLSIYWAP